MAFSLEIMTAWVKDNPIKTALIGAGVVGGIALAASKTARQFVGLSPKPSSRHALTGPTATRKHVKNTVNKHKAKNLKLK